MEKSTKNKSNSHSQYHTPHKAESLNMDSFSSEGYWDWNIVGEDYFVSQSWLQMLGLDPINDQPVKELWKTLLHPEDLEKTLAYIEQILNNNFSVYEQEFRMLHADNYYIWIQSKGRVFRDKQGKAVRVTGIHQNISQKKEKQQQLLNKEKKYKNLFENKVVAIFRGNVVTGEIIEANQKFWELTGVPSAKREGRKTLEFYSDLADRQLLIETIKEKGIAENMELKLKRWNGTFIWVNYSTVFYPEENILESVLVDISETKETYIKIKEANEKLDNFVFHASHDLRSPLKSAIGLINLYKKEKEVGLKDEYITKLEENVGRLDHMVGQLLDLSRSENIEKSIEEINFMIELNNAMTNNYHPGKDKAIEVTSNVAQRCKFVGNSARIRTILNNLISNAIKYIDLKKPKNTIALNAEVSEAKVVLHIKDNGIGIEKDQLDKIFDMFYRASEQGEGSGLGLFIVKSSLEAIDGHISLSSQKSLGTTFTLEIPNKN